MISNSPRDLPMSDIGLIEFGLQDKNYYILPISPKLVLEGVFYYDQAKNSSEPVIEGHDFSLDEAEYRLDWICSSAVLEVICPHKF